MTSKQILILRKDLNMRKGKLIAQGAHGSLLAYKLADRNDAAFKDWDEGRFTKIAVSVDSEEELLDIYSKAKKAGLLCCLITDAGLTEFNGVPTNTAVAIGPVWDKDVDPITGHLKLL